MKILYFLITFISFIGICKAQVNVGEMGFAQSESAGELTDEMVEQFRKTTTVFVLQDREKARLEEYKTVLSSGWFFNEFEVINQSEYESYAQKTGTYSFIYIRAIVIQRDAGRSGYYILQYSLPYLKGKKKREHKLSFVYLFPDKESEAYASKNSTFDKGYEDSLFVASQNATCFNYTPAHLKVYLSFISQNLNSKTDHYVYEQSQDDAQLKKLSKDTLFIPYYTYLLNYERAEVLKPETEKTIMKNYEFQYKVLSKESFEKKITDAEGQIYVLDYLLIQGVKSLTIFEARSGMIIYSVMLTGFKGGRINEKDLEKLSKKISSVVKG